MLSAMMQAFGMSRNIIEVPLGAERVIDLSGNIFQFALPENFSRDMPAPDLVEKVDLSQISDDDTGLLLERWWDIKEPKVFGRSLGTVMLTINIKQVVNNSFNILHDNDYDLRRDFDLIFANYERMIGEYPDSSEDKFVPGSIATMTGAKLHNGYQSFEINGQRWLRHGLTRGSDGHLKLGYIIPITTKYYLDVVFYNANNDDVSPWDMDVPAKALADRILKTMYIQYVESNEMREKVEREWIGTSMDEMLEKHYETIVPALFGPNALEQSKKPVKLPPELFGEE